MLDQIKDLFNYREMYDFIVSARIQRTTDIELPVNDFENRYLFRPELEARVSRWAKHFNFSFNNYPKHNDTNIIVPEFDSLFVFTRKWQDVTPDIYPVGHIKIEMDVILYIHVDRVRTWLTKKEYDAILKLPKNEEIDKHYITGDNQ